jgi:chromosome segregation ATPase
MRTTLRISALASLLLASACTGNGDCDPTKGGLFGAIGCDASGGYDKRIQDRQQQQAALLQRKAELTREQEQLESERTSVARDLRAKEAAKGKAEKELAAVRKKLAASQGENRALQEEAKALERQLGASKREIDDLQQAEQRKAARLAELEKEQRNLNKEYDAATGR